MDRKYGIPDQTVGMERGERMASIAELQSRIWSYRQTVKECDIKIERLNKVYNELGEIKGTFRRSRNDTKDIFEEKGTWRGDTHTSFCKAGDELDGICGNYYRNLDAAQDMVNKKIAELKAKKYELIPIINSLVALVQDMLSDIENAVN